VLGQPIFHKEGGLADYSFADFVGDYSRLFRVIERALDGSAGAPGHEILVLSGDIHTGRYAVGHRGDREIHELIASPASRVQPGGTSFSEPAYAFPVGRGADARQWHVDPKPYMTADDNVAVVKLTPGTNGRVKMRFRIFRVRPVDDRSWWDKVKGQPRD